jgi:hypothetical protein
LGSGYFGLLFGTSTGYWLFYSSSTSDFHTVFLFQLRFQILPILGQDPFPDFSDLFLIRLEFCPSFTWSGNCNFYNSIAKWVPFILIDFGTLIRAIIVLVLIRIRLAVRSFTGSISEYSKDYRSSWVLGILVFQNDPIKYLAILFEYKDRKPQLVFTIQIAELFCCPGWYEFPLEGY